MSKTIYNFSSYSDTQLDSEAENIITKVTDSEAIASPLPDIATVTAHLQEYRTALAEASLGDRQKVVLKNQKRGQLERTLRALALHVELVAAGDEAVILGAGFGTRMTAHTVQDMPLVTDFKVKFGEPGSGIARAQVKYRDAVRQYRFDYRLVGTEEWTTVMSSQSRVVLEALQNYQQYEFRVAYIGRGTNPKPHFSETLTTIIL